MKRGCQFGAMLAIGLGLLVGASAANAQKPHADRPPQSHPAPPHAQAPPQPHPRNQNANRPPASANRTPVNPNQGNNRANKGAGANMSQRQQLGAGAPRPWVDTMRSLTPADRERVLQNSKAFQNLSPDKQNKIRQQFNQWDRMTPGQRADQQIKEDNWRHLTPEQREHIKNDVVPKWKQMPWDRQQVMKQKLGVLQNMPESARNQRLNDPNFTKGMSEDERSMLQDLSHTHVGGPPEE